MDALAYYTVELSRPEDGWARLQELAADARRAADELTSEGTPVRYVRTIFVPEDETCFYLYEGPSADAVRQAARHAGLGFERVAEAVAESNGNKKWDADPELVAGSFLRHWRLSRLS